MKLDALSCCVQSSQDRANADKLPKQLLSEGKKAGRTHIQSKTPAPPGICQSTGHDPRLSRRPGFCIIYLAKHLALLWPQVSGSSKPPSSLVLLARWCGILRSEQVPGLLCDSSTPWQLAAPRRCQLRRGLGGGALEVSLLDSMLRIWTASFGIHYRKDSLHVLPLYRKAPSPLPSNTSFRRTSTQSPGTLTKARHHVAAQSLV